MLFTAHLAALLLAHAAEARGAFCIQAARERRATREPGAPSRAEQNTPLPAPACCPRNLGSSGHRHVLDPHCAGVQQWHRPYSGVAVLMVQQQTLKNTSV